MLQTPLSYSVVVNLAHSWTCEKTTFPLILNYNSYDFKYGDSGHDK